MTASRIIIVIGKSEMNENEECKRERRFKNKIKIIPELQKNREKM